MTTCMYAAKHCLVSGVPGWVFSLIVVPWALLAILITCQLIYMVKIKGITIIYNHYENFWIQINFIPVCGVVGKRKLKSIIFHSNRYHVSMHSNFMYECKFCYNLSCMQKQDDHESLQTATTYCEEVGNIISFTMKNNPSYTVPK